MDHTQFQDYSSESLSSTPNSLQAVVVELQETDKLVNGAKSYTSYTSSPSSSESASPTPKLSSRELTIAMLGAAAGNCMEWYNFSLFGLLANVFGELFFPESNASIHLFQAYGIFAATFFMRPLGGLIFGYLGDRLGRIYALKLSIFMMGITTLITACLPTYSSIGITSTFLMIAVRLVQGLSAGAEFPAAMVYINEICPSAHQAKFAILCQITGFGGLVASGAVALLNAIFTEQQILDWAWRIPFVFGCLIGLFGIWSRHNLNSDSPAFEKAQQHGETVANPVAYALQTCKWRMCSIVFHCMLVVSQSFILFQWLPTYFSFIGGYTFNAFAINIFAYLITAGTGLLSAHWIDSSRTMTSSKMIRIFGPMQLILAVVLFQFLNDPQDGVLAITIWLIMAATFGMYFGAAYGVWFMDMLPDLSCRLSAFGIAYNVGSLWGGTASLIATFVESEFGGVGAVGYLLLLFGVISIGNDVFASQFMHKSNLKTLR